uniref:sensor histidine kinase n=1 Tax=Pararhizobium sp. IMCC3301 TaxID=3067904 RepID=UPI002740EABE|nr:HAMP domain-containing sensor histidine kinase [Pararhizobium sp. IMCC3301]
MRPAKIYRSAAAKLAAAFFGVFLLLFLIATVTTYLSLRDELIETVDDRLKPEHEIISALWNPDARDSFIENVRALAALSDPKISVLLLTASGGSRLAGNVDPFPVKSGFSMDPLTQVKRREDYSYRLYSRPVGDMQLTIGGSLEDTQELLETSLINLAWTSALAVFLAIIGSVFLSRKVQRRLSLVSDTMNRVAGGNLDARIPLSKSADDLDRLSGTINDALDQLKLLVDGMRQVTTDIAHDLKTPLNRLAFTIEDALQKDAAGEPVSKRLEVARDECENINRTFEALLRIAQIEAGARNKSHFVALDLTALIETIADIYADVATDSGMSLQTEPAGPPVLIVGDEQLLMQMLVNLVENAIRHCGPDTVISLATSVSDDQPQIRISDTGPGIPENERCNVLRRLYRLEKSRTTSGNGLGLALVKAVAEMHGARAELTDNQPGLQVSIVFPATSGETIT